MRIIILGAGISGLSLAWYLEKKFSNIQITILEQKNRVGGWIQTKKFGGFLFECGPRSFRAKEVPLIRELGLENELITAHKDAKNKYIAIDQKLHCVPDNFLSLFTTRLGRKCLKGLVSYPFRRKTKAEDESIQSYFEKRFGKDFADTFIDPLMAGIYAAHPSELSYQAAHLSFERGRKLFSFKEGMQTLPNALAAKLRADIQLGNSALHISEKEKNIEVDTEKETLTCDYLFSTLTSENLKALLPKQDALRDLLPEVPRSSVAQVALGFHEDLLTFSGFGFLTPSREEKNLLGCIFDSKVFPEQNQGYKTRLSIMLGGTRVPELLSLPDEALQEMALSYAAKYLGIQSKPQVAHVAKAQNAISVYPVNYLKKRARVEEHLRTRRIAIFGAGLYKVALSDCIVAAHDMAESFSLKF